MGCLTEPEAFYEDASRVLKEGGVLLSTYTNQQSLLLRFNYLFRRRDTTRFRLYSWPEVSRHLSENHFQIEMVVYYNFFLSTHGWIFPSRTISRLLDRLGTFPGRRHLARNFLVLARKK